MIRSTVSPVINLDALYSTSVLKRGVATAFAPSRIGRAMISVVVDELFDCVLPFCVTGA